MTVDKKFLLLQINDSLFPIGSYVHSFGLETYVQKGRVKNAPDAFEYLKASLKTWFLHAELLSLKLVFSHALQGDVEEILRLEEIVCASSSPMESRLATQKLGSRFIKTVGTFGLSRGEVFDAYVKRTVYPTHSSAYGVFCASLGMEIDEALRHFLYAWTSSQVTNCVKTVPLSQNDGQKILFGLHGVFSEVLERLRDLRETDLCASSVFNDVMAMQHERLYSRLYMS